MSQQILEGVKILDLSTMIAAPMAATYLAEFGADVIHVEGRVHGDPMRVSGLNKDGIRLYPKLLQRNKRCITLDLHQPEAQEQFLKLAQWADVVVTNFRPQALRKFHVDYDDVVKVKPDTIYMHFSAYGRTGPNAEKPGFARVCEAYSGLTYITGYPDRPPTLAGTWIVDGLGGIHAAYSIMLALYHKKCTGEGQLVEEGLYEPMFRILDDLPVNYSVNGVIRQRMGNMQAQVVPNNVYTSKDGHYIVLPVNGSMFERLLKAMNREDLMDDPRFNTGDARVKNRELVDKTVADWVSTLNRDEVDRLLNEHDVAHGPINSIKDIFEDPHFWIRESLVKVYDEELGMDIVEPGIIPKMSKTPGEIKWNGPAMGSSNDEVFLNLLKLSPEKYEALKEKGAI